jgi:SnoaL-like domain
MSVPEPIARWHEVVASRDMAALDQLLDPGVVFVSPVVHTPQVGRDITRTYLGAAMSVLNNGHFRYLGEWFAEDSAVLEFETELDGIVINGIDMIRWNAQGRIVHFKVMVRPLKAINMLHQMMGRALSGGQQ